MTRDDILRPMPLSPAEIVSLIERTRQADADRLANQRDKETGRWRSPYASKRGGR